MDGIFLTEGTELDVSIRNKCYTAIRIAQYIQDSKAVTSFSSPMDKKRFLFSAVVTYYMVYLTIMSLVPDTGLSASLGDTLLSSTVTKSYVNGSFGHCT